MRSHFRIATILITGVAITLNLHVRLWPTQDNLTSFSERYLERSPHNAFVSYRHCKLKKDMCELETSKITFLSII